MSMHKRKYKIPGVLYGICLLLLTTSLPVTATSNLGANSDAIVSFEPGTGPTNPVDPENPGTEIPGEGVEGELVIVLVSDFNFGTASIASETQFIDITTVQPNIQIADLRGKATGWQLKATVSPFSNEGEGVSLPGAAIHIKGGRFNSVSSMDLAPTATANLKLEADGEFEGTVITAGVGKGTGLWVDRLYPATGAEDALVQLEIPPGVGSVGNHTAEIVWALSNTP